MCATACRIIQYVPGACIIPRNARRAPFIQSFPCASGAPEFPPLLDRPDHLAHRNMDAAGRPGMARAAIVEQRVHSRTRERSRLTADSVLLALRRRDRRQTRQAA